MKFEKKSLIWVLIVIGVIPVLFGLMGRLHWFLDAFSHFRVYYVIYFLSLSVVAIILKRKKESIVGCVLTLLLATSFIKFYTPSFPNADNPHTLKIASINLLTSNTNFEKVINYIDASDFDIIFFLELNSQWQSKIEQVEGYPVNYFLARNDNFGIGLISKVEIDSIQNVALNSVGIPSLLANLIVEGEELSILGTHPVPPIGSSYFEMRNNQFDRINNFVQQTDTDLILIGDLNTTSFSPNFNLLLRNGKLRDSREGFGILTTWNAHLPLISITLDHVLITDGIKVIDREVGESVGSDHLPTSIEIGIKN